VGLQLKEDFFVSKISIAILLLLVHLNAYAYPIHQLTGAVEQVIDRTIFLNNEKFRPSGYASSLPGWVIQGSEVTISYSCNELGDCYYIDIAEANGDLPLMDKINQELLDFERVFP